MMEGKTRLETFTDYDDAYYFMDQALREHGDWELEQGSGIQYINYQWRVGLSWKKESKKRDEQLIPVMTEDDFRNH